MRRIATPIEKIIAAAARSGDQVYVRVGNGTPVAELWLDGPTLVAAVAEGGDHRMGARLISTGHLAGSELERTRSTAHAHGASLAAALSEHVRRDVIAALARDEARYALAAALAAPAEDVVAAGGASPNGHFPLAIDATELLGETNEFLASVRDAQMHAPPASLPVATEQPSPDLALSPEEWALLSRADGSTTVAHLAEECGFPQPEASLIVTRLAGIGLLTIEPGLESTADLMAELEAAQDLAAVSAAFEHAVQELPPPPQEDPPEHPALVSIEPAERVVIPEPEDEAPVAPPPPPPGELAMTNGDRTVDTQALLRELSSIARAPRDSGR